MKTMKKLIAISLAVVMVVAVLATMVVPAGAMVWMADENNTTNFIASADTEIVINAGKLPENYSDGTPVSVELGTGDADWNYAYPHTLNKLFTPGNYSGKLDADVYIMYDSENVYIKEVRRNAMTSGDQSVYKFLLSDKIMGTSRSEATPVGAYVTVVFNLNAAEDSTVSNTVSGRKTKYAWPADNADNTKSAWYYVDEDTVISGITSTSTLENGTYVCETAIPWTCIGDCTSAPEVGTLLGFKHKPKVGGDNYFTNIKNCSDYGSQAGHKEGQTTYHDEWDNFIPMYLRAEDAKAAEQCIDVSWYSRHKTEFDIYTAGQLRGLSYITNQYLTYYNHSTVTDTSPVSEASHATSGKTFNIVADIDLNPNWSVDDDATIPPLYVWYDLVSFCGTLNGNGHVIRGFYADDVWCAYNLKTKGNSGDYFFDVGKTGNKGNDTTTNAETGATTPINNRVDATRDRGFIGTIWDGNGTNINNLMFLNCKVVCRTNNSGGLIGSFSGINMTIRNIYADIDMDSNVASNRWSYTGGIIGKFANAKATILENIVYVGNMDVAAASGNNDYGAVPIWASGAHASGITNADNKAEDLLVIAGRITKKNNHFTNGGARSETNVVTINTDGKLTGASGKALTDYPSHWVNIDEDNKVADTAVKMPPEVAAMIDSSLWVQEKVEADNMSIRVLSGLNSIENSWDKFGVKVEILTANGYVMVKDDAGKLVSDKVYTSIEAAGATVEASELGTTYIGGVVLSNAPKSITLRITPVKYSNGAEHCGASAVVSYVNGVLQ